jgi:hypothetical protein
MAEWLGKAAPCIAPGRRPSTAGAGGKNKGPVQGTEGITTSVVFKKVEDKMLREYNRIIGLWNQYDGLRCLINCCGYANGCYAEEHTDDNPSACNLKSLKTS